MSYYNHMASQLQSRIAKRAAQITLNTYWKTGYRELGRMKDWRESKEILAELTTSQILDKKLLQLAHAAAKEWELFANARPAPNGYGYYERNVCEGAEYD